MPTANRILKMKQVLNNRQLDLTVVFENIHDPHNVSAILRTCDAVGIQNVKSKKFFSSGKGIAI